MPERRGGSYVADPRTGEERRVEGTVQEDVHVVEPVDEPRAEPRTEPAAAPTAEQGGEAAQRRGAPVKPKE